MSHASNARRGALRRKVRLKKHKSNARKFSCLLEKAKTAHEVSYAYLKKHGFSNDWLLRHKSKLAAARARLPRSTREPGRVPKTWIDSYYDCATVRLQMFRAKLAAWRHQAVQQYRNHGTSPCSIHLLGDSLSQVGSRPDAFLQGLKAPPALVERIATQKVCNVFRRVLFKSTHPVKCRCGRRIYVCHGSGAWTAVP